MSIERERHGQGDERDAERQERFGQQTQMSTFPDRLREQ
jgi:hypothetical protein